MSMAYDLTRRIWRKRALWLLQPFPALRLVMVEGPSQKVNFPVVISLKTTTHIRQHTRYLALSSIRNAIRRYKNLLLFASFSFPHFPSIIIFPRKYHCLWLHFWYFLCVFENMLSLSLNRIRVYERKLSENIYFQTSFHKEFIPPSEILHESFYALLCPRLIHTKRHIEACWKKAYTSIIGNTAQMKDRQEVQKLHIPTGNGMRWWAE